MSNPTNRTVERGSGALAGVVSFLIGYVITYAWQSSAVERAIAPLNLASAVFGGDPISVWKVVGWLFFGAHFVPTDVRVGPLGPQSVDLIAGGDDSLVLLYLLPPILLGIAGLLVARRYPGTGSLGDRALTGATVVLGYAPLVILSAFLVRVGNTGPALAQAVLVAGVLYPVVFGGLGALAGSAIDRR